MGTHLRQALRTLCFNAQFKYAVFWKLRHRARMMLTWEDAYYDNHELRDSPENMCFTEIGGNLIDWHPHDPLGLAVAKMSCHVYSLGEGVIGQVAVTGKHKWIFADKLGPDSYSPFEHYDGWQTQFSAGINTVVVVAVVPHGVVQLGSLYKLPEDLKLVNHIRDAFFALQDSSVGCIPRVNRCTMGTPSCLSDISTRSSGSGDKGKTIIRSSSGILVDCSYVDLPPGDKLKKTVEASSKDGGLELSTLGSDESGNLLQSSSDFFFPERRKQVHTRLRTGRRCEGETSGFGYLGVGSEDLDTPLTHHSLNKKVKLPVDDSAVDQSYLESDLLDFAACRNQNGMICITEPFDTEIQKVLNNNIDFPKEINNMGSLETPFKFSADCELYEVLGPAFRKRSSYSDFKAEKTVTETAVEMPEVMESSSLLTAVSCSEHLLEAVVANVCCSGSDTKSQKSFCKSGQSQLTTEKLPQPSCDEVTVGSVGYSFDQSLVEKHTLHCLSSEACGVSSSMGFSSRSHSTFSEHLNSAQEPAKINKKRAKPGENCRPRPRDRQLIQDRIKELRELVPNGSKCSIDSLLERTIKHMQFMQSITKHADKLNKCTESRLHDKDKVLRGLPRYDQGSSWAMEVGGHLKVCPIKVENINMNGQMLIEMLCEESGHFLEIAETIRSMGLMILKGATEALGKKTLMCFVVEGQNNRSLHRMDILWSLVQILQSKTTV